MEIWKDVLGYKGFYKVSDQGNVKNCYEKPVAVSVNADGVCSVMLTAFKTSRRMSLHYLVWGAFNEFLNTSDKIRHIDGDKTNNKLSNLSRSTGRKMRLSMKENWVDIDGTDLKVSTFGRVKSSKILKPKFNSTGCQFYMIDGKVSYIHDILARVFLGWNGVDGYAGYRDRNTSNTDLSNIVIKDYRLKYKKIMD